jgi:transcriptional regulator NrdR family protein
VNTEQNFDIEERIHINYRLAYLKDTVMARYIDDIALKVINQLIQSNNREIVSIIFGLNLN